ncbi:MAG: SDR family oxidoreductase [Marinilabiliales bacterium]
MEYDNFLKGKKILITGASSGIGQEIAIRAAKYGANLIITGRDIPRLNKTLSMLEKGNHAAIPADLTKKEQLDNIISSIKNIDGLVHSAGITRYSPAHLISEKKFDEIININFKAPMFLTSGMLRKKLINSGSSIVFLSSIATCYPYYGGSLYISSKAAVEGFVKVLALELADKKIRVNSVLPAFVETPMLDDASNTISRDTLNQFKNILPFGFGKTGDVAETVIFLLSEKSKWITGQQIKLGAF